jgi:inhibitor of cysteine peptidase
MKKKWFLFGGVLFIIMALITMITFKPSYSAVKGPGITEEGDIASIESKEALNAYFLKRLKEEEKRMKQSIWKESAATSEESSKADTGSSQDFSNTNVQVEGIDEGDTVKTDGTHIFQVKDGKLQMIRAVPASEMTLDALITYDSSFSPTQLFLHKNSLIVMGHSYEKMTNTTHGKGKDIGIAPIHETTKAIIYDVKDKKNPKKLREIDIEGTLVSSRLMDGKAYLIANKYPDIWLLKENAEIDLRPRYYDSQLGAEAQAADYKDIQYFPQSQETNFTNIAVIDLENPNTKMQVTAFVGSGDQLFMSKENLYLAVNKYVPWMIETSRSSGSQTTVYKFSINGMKVDFHSSSDIKGTILNQFSMDEYKGYFRIATTDGFVWDENRPSANNLYILDENLDEVGKLENLARGERIYSARFMNDRIYIVTFRETDPLFVIDGSDPKNPKVLGELKIPGFSNYLHPYDENHLIGFGHDTKVTGKGVGDRPIILTDGVKISLFDVSDMANPKEKFTEIIGGRGTYSPLNYDHKALLFNKKQNVIAFPIAVYENKKNSPYESEFSFQGAYVYNLDLTKGFTLKGRITHQKSNIPYEEWENNIDRLIYIGDVLYTLSPDKINAYNLNSMQAIGKLTMK